MFGNLVPPSPLGDHALPADGKGKHPQKCPKTLLIRMIRGDSKGSEVAGIFNIIQQLSQA